MSPIHPTALIDPGAEVDAGAVIGPYCIVGAHVRLHAGVRLLAHVVVDGPCEIGPDVEVHPFARLGGPPQHVQHRNEPTRLEIGAGCTIREHVSMNRGTARGAGITRIGPNGYFMAQAHVGHDCDVGARVTLAQAATLGGHVRVGDGAMLGGLCAVHQRCRVGRLAMIGGLAAVVGDVPPFTIAAGNHAQLAGLNAVGLRREGVSGEALHALRSAYKYVFEGEGVFAERVAQARGMGGADPLVLEFLDFLSMARPRPLAHARAPA